MAVKTITIDMDAYALLSAEKRGNESFSRVIKRRLLPARTARSLLAALPGCLLSPEALDLTEAVVRDRVRSMPASRAINTEI